MVLNRAVSRTHWNMTSIFSLFSSADNVSLPMIMSCTVLSDKTNYVTSLFSAQHIVAVEENMGRVFICLTTETSRVVYNMKVKAKMGTETAAINSHSLQLDAFHLGP